MKRWPCLVICILSLLSMGFGPPRLADSDFLRYGLTPEQIKAMREIPAPEVTAEAAILVNNTTGQIILAKNEHERRAPASLTKIMTAIVALERGRQEQEMVVSRQDRNAWSVLQLYTGEELNLRQLLFALLIPSDNAASMTIARSLAGSYDAFVSWMNQKAAAWGLQNTHFGNPSGLDTEDGYSTAYDVAIMTRNAMTYPTFAEIVRKPDWIVNMRKIESTNELLNVYPGLIGVKTGTTDLAGDCLATVCDRAEGQALTVVMGSTDRFHDTTLLLDYYYANFAEVTIDLQDTPQSRYMDSEGNWHALRIAQPSIILVKPWQVDSINIYHSIQDHSPTPDASKPVGQLQVYIGSQPVAEVAMYAQ